MDGTLIIENCSHLSCDHMCFQSPIQHTHTLHPGDDIYQDQHNKDYIVVHSSHRMYQMHTLYVR